MKSWNPEMLNDFLGATQLIGDNRGSRIRLLHFDAWTSQWDALSWWKCLHKSDPDVINIVRVILKEKLIMVTTYTNFDTDFYFKNNFKFSSFLIL